MRRGEVRGGASEALLAIRPRVEERSSRSRLVGSIVDEQCSFGLGSALIEEAIPAFSWLALTMTWLGWRLVVVECRTACECFPGPGSTFTADSEETTPGRW